jgi:hypothetical protein
VRSASQALEQSAQKFFDASQGSMPLVAKRFALHRSLTAKRRFVKINVTSSVPRRCPSAAQQPRKLVVETLKLFVREVWC